jgi:hypothetical protein
MIKKPYSQKIAGVFEIVNYLLAPIPLAFGGLLLFFVPWMFLLVLMIWIFCAPGLWLAALYFKHSRGELDEEKILGMWLGTIAFNGFFLLVNVCFVYRNYSPSDKSYYPLTILTVETVWVVLVIWWLLAILLALTAIRSEERNSR